MKTTTGFATGLRKWGMLTLALTMTVSVMSACSGGNSKEGAEKHVLRLGVLYGGSDQESWTRQQYTDTFEMLNPNVDFEIVSAINWNDQRFETPGPDGMNKQPDPYEKIKEMMTGNNPVDVVIIDYSMLRRLYQENLLKQLDPLIQQSKMDLSDYVPAVIDGIKEASDGNIYALTPTFSSSALFYNKKIFAEAGVEPPTDNMTWDDVIAKAKLVSKGTGGDRQYGLQISRWGGDGFSDTTVFGSALQLKVWDDKGEKMLVNNSEWESVWNTVADLYKQKIVPSSEDINQINEKLMKAAGDSYYNPTSGDLFVNGKVAMTIGEYYYINELNQYMNNASKIKDFEPFEWDVVTPPTHASKPGIGGNVFLGSLMAINQNAQNPDDAWKFIQFSNSKEWAELKSRSTYELVARKEFLKPKDGAGYNINAFATLKPVPPPSADADKVMRDKPNIYEAQSPGYELFQQVVKGDKSAKEALQEWETKGNVVLQRLKTNPNGNNAGEGEGGGGTIDIKPLESVGSAPPATEEAVE
ncbi:ABC transporter substrate-binding protein [Paenibacillus sp. NPDC058071]|uniref:ABC transporter substrate-binding protein n=1 Tax=Paenibacillus sp. NPDC058071 TaxID=3346326 RepID=UPI0036DD2AE3